MFSLIGILVTAFVEGHSQITKQGFVQVDDGCLYYSEMGTGIPIIVVHGRPDLDREYLQPQLFKLAKNHRVIFYDQRGSGKSLETKMDAKHINLVQFVEDLESLRQSLGINQFILMGHSWGGLLSMQYAISYPKHLLGLILLNTSPADYRGKKAFVDEFIVRTKNIQNEIAPLSNYEKFEKLTAPQISDLYRKLFSVDVYKPEIVNDLHLSFSVQSAQNGFKVMQEMSKTSWIKPSTNLFPQLTNLTVPTFILHGKEDIVPAWTAMEIKNAIPNAEIVIINESGHFTYVEQSDQFFIQVDKFLNKIRTR